MELDKHSRVSSVYASAMETPCNADSPFDPASHTPDVILRSSDNVDFYVMKTFLAFSSPDVFGGMFTLPQTQPNIPSSSGLHIVPVTEDSEALRILLLHCYPLDPQDEDNDVGDIVRAMSAARKYAMDFTEKKIEKRLSSKTPSLLDENPLHVYAVACRYGLEELGRAAARKTLEIPPSHLPPSPELNHITGMDMYQLTKFRHRCVEAIWDWYFRCWTEPILVEETPAGPLPVPFVWFTSESHKNTPGQTCSFITTSVVRLDDWNYRPVMDPSECCLDIYATPWWSTYFVALMRAIELCPSRKTVFDFSEEDYYTALTAASSCTLCNWDAARHLDGFRKHFAWNIDRIVEKVKLSAFRLSIRVAKMLIYFCLGVKSPQVPNTLK